MNHRSVTLCVAGLVLTSALQAQPAVPSVVDEPLGARYSLGMTLWHLGHNASMIERFHNFVRAQDLSPEKLLPASAQQPPASTTQLLLEPELLAQEQLDKPELRCHPGPCQEA